MKEDNVYVFIALAFFGTLTAAQSDNSEYDVIIRLFTFGFIRMFVHEFVGADTVRQNV